MKRLLVVMAVAGLPMMIVAGSSAAMSFSSSKSNIYREFPGTRLVTALAAFSGPNQTQIVFRTSPTGDFILTQFCTNPVTGGMLLSLSGLGGIAQTNAGNLCYNFQPGFIMPQGTAITCATGALAEIGSHFCAIAGLFRE